MSKACSSLLRSARQARAFARGEAKDGFVVHVPEEMDALSAITEKPPAPNSSAPGSMNADEE